MFAAALVPFHLFSPRARRRQTSFLLRNQVGTALAAALSSGCGPAPAPDGPTAGIAAMLEESAVAWNRGDLDGFMASYLADTATVFVTADSAHRGFAWIRARYAPRFAPEAARDSLRFERIAARALGPEHAVATAHYVLMRGDSVTATGPFTIVLRRTPAGWKIIHDHTS